MSRSRSTLLVLAIALATTAACKPVGPDYEAPSLALPDQWSAGAAQGVRTDTSSLAGWWKALGDPVLDGLVARAIEGNRDLDVARARLRQARASRRAATGALFPAADASATYSRRDPGSGGAEDLFTGGLDASWEIDLFGGLRRALESSEADVGAARADLRDALVTVLAEVALSYVDVRTLQSRLGIAHANAASQADTYAIAKWRYDAGLIGALDVDQAAYNLAQTRARIPDLETALVAARNRIAVLLGRNAGSVDGELEATAAVPLPPATVAVGVPADLLRRRPDVEAAERRLASATAAIGVAAADLYPRLALTGSISVSAASVAGLDEGSARALGIGPTLSWRVFDAGRIRAAVAAQSAVAEEALAAYEAAVLAAGEEAENALTAYAGERVRRDHLADAAAAARSAADLAQLQYRSGVVDFQSVLEAERARLDLEDALAASTAKVTTNLVALYKALGGGWQIASPEGGPDEAKPATPPESAVAEDAAT